ncbi:MAG: flagellar hook-basal body protein [Pirellulaceae bacterium]
MYLWLGAQSFSHYVDVISNNIANANTAGFRRELPVLQARHAEAIERGDVPAGMGLREDIGGGVYLSETRTDFTPGSFEQTGSPTDLAIADREGKTFFVVEGDQAGEQLLTRAGNFYVDGTGTLRTQDDRAVLSVGGTAVRVDPRFPIHVASDGVVSQPEVGGGGVPLLLLQPRDLLDLERAGNNLFRNSGQTIPAGPADRQVRQGVVEHSSTQPVYEMTELIKASRAYEANIRMMQHHDETANSLISRLLTP